MAALSNSLNGLLYSLGVFMRDAVRGRVTEVVAATPYATFKDSNLGGILSVEDNHFAGSEVYFESPVGVGANKNPFQAASSLASDGTIVLTQGYGAASAPLGAEYVLQNIKGQGYPHAIKMEALLQVLREMGVMTRTKVTVATPNAVSYWNAIPAGIDSIYGVEAVNGAGERAIVNPNHWGDRINFQDRTIYLPFGVYAGLTFQIFGRVKYNENSDPAVAIPNINTNRIVAAAAERLMAPSGIAQDRRVWQGLYESRMRQYRDLPLANEVFLIDTL